jgi:hypothetical protein
MRNTGVPPVSKAFKNNPEAMELFQEASKKIGYIPSKLGRSAEHCSASG